MLRKRQFIILFVLGTLTSGFTQETVLQTSEQSCFLEGLALFQSDSFASSLVIFNSIIEEGANEKIRSEASYFAAAAATKLHQKGAGRLMQQFIAQHPESIRKNAAIAAIATSYFNTENYAEALKWYDKVDEKQIAPSDRMQFNFNYGYSLFSMNKISGAKNYLARAVSSPKYGSEAEYYLGYIAYQQNDYEEANKRFDQIDDKQQLKEKLSYYQADMNFKQGNFQEAIALAKIQLVKRISKEEVSELNKIIGESYFNLNQYSNALPYLESYQGKDGKWSNTDYYQLGYCYYMQEDFGNAIQQFNRIIGGINGTAQNAYYHLAACYLKLDKKQEALNAFRNAAEMDYSATIKKDAHLNYAQLSYEIGNAYESTAEVITTYLEKYPKDAYKKELQKLRINAYIQNKNYAEALLLLENNADISNARLFQEVAFFKGLGLFKETQYTEASVAFSKALMNKADELLTTKATYWKAEADYNLNKFQMAESGFELVVDNKFTNEEEFRDLNYSLGYAYFKQQNYKKATGAFSSFVSSSKSTHEKKHNAYLRLGDSYYATSSYEAAIAAYTNALKFENIKNDYASYQTALCYGYLDNTDNKIAKLEMFIASYSTSNLVDDALLELAEAYVTKGLENKGLATYDQLILDYKESALVPKALLNQGLLYYNSNNPEKALGKLKLVVAKFPKSQEATQAVGTAKLVYVDLGKVEEYVSWVNTLDFVEVTTLEVDNATFESAQKQERTGALEAAIVGYKKYLNSFPNGDHVAEASFSLAQLYFSQGKKEAALPYYKRVATIKTSNYAEQGLTRICEIYSGKEAYTEALPYLLQLEEMASIPQNKVFAQSNLMKSYYEVGNYPKTIVYAEKVLGTADIDDRIGSDAQIMIARAALATKDETKARVAYKKVLKKASGIVAAEALYYDAYFKNKDGDFENSNSALQKLVKEYSNYKEWGGKGLLLMADNFYKLKDGYQATYILESVIANFNQFPIIVASAKGELAIIKAKEAQHNSSIKLN